MAFMHHQWTYLSVLVMIFSVIAPLAVIALLGTYGYEPMQMTETVFEGTSSWLFSRSEFWLFAFFPITYIFLIFEFILKLSLVARYFSINRG